MQISTKLIYYCSDILYLSNTREGGNKTELYSRYLDFKNPMIQLG
jgi:hypothetical protein